MGFRCGAFAKVWDVSPISDTRTKLRISVSRKNKQTGAYEQDFSGYVMALGTAAASKAASLKKGDSIKLGDIDVTTKYDKEKEVGYTNYSMFSFSVENSGPAPASNDPQPEVGDGEISNNRQLPF